MILLGNYKIAEIEGVKFSDAEAFTDEELDKFRGACFGDREMQIKGNFPDWWLITAKWYRTVYRVMQEAVKQEVKKERDKKNKQIRRLKKKIAALEEEIAANPFKKVNSKKLKK